MHGTKKGDILLEIPHEVLVDGSTASIRVEGIEHYGRVSQPPLLKSQALKLLHDKGA